MKTHHVEGSIVNLSSVSALLPFPLHTLYSLSKAAVDELTRSLATELGQYKAST